MTGAYIAIGMLYGQGDFEKTIEITTRCGQDSDCNPASAAGVLGVMQGFHAIPDKFVAGLPAIADRKFDYTDYSFNEIVDSTEIRIEQVVERNGGQVNDDTVAICLQFPRPPQLERWSPGIPDRRIGVADEAWSWSRDWRTEDGRQVGERGGCEATLRFSGVAVAVLGRLDQAGGRADVYLDDTKQVLPLDAYIVPNTHDDVLWQAYDLKPGEHTLRIVTRGDADPRSAGTRVAIQQAITFVPEQE
jgi:hypothetical protein